LQSGTFIACLDSRQAIFFGVNMQFERQTDAQSSPAMMGYLFMENETPLGSGR
jgi:uncharacterized protein YggL (DUF469 family)